MIEGLKKAAVLGLVFGVGAAAGRYTVPTKAMESREVTQADKKKEDVTTDSNKNKHVVTTVVESTKPSGNKTKITKIVSDTTSADKSKVTLVDVDSKRETDKKETSKDSSRVAVNALAAYDINSRGALTYGLQVTSTVVGPVTIGVFGFTSGIGGCSLGLTF